MASLLRGKIYKIVCNITGEVYIGSTTKTLEERLRGHEYDYKHFLQGSYHFVSSFNIIEQGDYRIELIEEFEVESKDELRKIEGQYQRDFDCVNKNIAGRTVQEYRQEHRDYYKDYNKQYYQEHKEEILEYQQKYRQEHRDELKRKANQKIDCECGGKFTLSNKSLHLKTKKHQKYLNSLK